MLPLNPALARLPVYQPGRPIEEVARELGLPAADIIKLASNENPLGPSPAALAAMERVLKNLHLYPDGNAFYLKRRLAEKLGVRPENLILGNGSNEILEFIGHALIVPGTEVVASQYCFAVYPIVTALFGGTLVTVPARELGHDLPAMLRAITPRTRVVFAANPNNPTGTLAPDADVLRLVHETPPHVLVALDQAYVEFLDAPTEGGAHAPRVSRPAPSRVGSGEAAPQGGGDAAGLPARARETTREGACAPPDSAPAALSASATALDLLPLVRSGERPNLLLLRTFSKIYGLAGLRLGYGIGHPDLIAALEKVRQPFNINALVQAGALAALDDDEHIARTRQNNRAGLKFFEDACRQLGVKFIPSSANFLLVHVGDGARICAELQKLGVITRPMGGYQLPEYLRISIGTPAENERCVAALRQVLGR